MKIARHLPPRSAEIALKRNLRPDPKNDGKFKFSIDQRMKLCARPPFSLDFWMKVRKQNPVPTLALVTTLMFKFLEKYNDGVDLPKMLDQTLPYFKMVKFESQHDVHLILPDQLAPHTAEFLELDLSTIPTKKSSNV